ncbi:MAG: 50S ribosomal protein L10 [Candidatus Pacearchaeota archaeon]
MSGKRETHVSETKKRKVRELAEQMKRKTVMVVSVKGLPSAQFQDIKKKLRNLAKISVAKKSLIDFALEHCGIKELHDLVPYVEDSTAILFSDSDAFEISLKLSEEKSPAKAKAGQVAPEDLIVPAGPTDLIPGPDISALSAVGLQPKVESGKIAIVKEKVLCPKGEVIDEKKASILAKLNIIPFKIGIDPVAAYMGGKIYKDIIINKEETLKDLEENYRRSLAFAVELNYLCSQTMDFILSRAEMYKKAIEGLAFIGGEQISELNGAPTK